ncbi:hypothetical protein RJ55_03252 [Drechmeria coniospora]|nr:hypothetical protein RJ55_03252 [Drechmeria coniospora]
MFSAKTRHYSYECKSSTQERPYVARPSRSQQLRNPKLVPKLANTSLEPVEAKKGVADEELAKREAERAKQRGQDQDEGEDEVPRATSKRPRSLSANSISTISTDNSGDRMRNRNRSRSAEPRKRKRSPGSPNAEGGRRGNGSRNSHSRSPSPPQRRGRARSRDSHSPVPERTERLYRSRDHRVRNRDAPPELKGNSAMTRDGREPPARRPYYSRSPERGSRRQERKENRLAPAAGEDRERHGGRSGVMQADQRSRERSLSPFSKRLALTRELKGDAR